MNELNLWLLYAQYATMQKMDTPNVTTQVAKVTNVSSNTTSVLDFKSTFVQEMLPYAEHIAQKVGAPVSALLAQSALESNWGRNTSGDNNLFGIKSRNGKEVSTSEFINGRMVQIKDTFANYQNVSESWNHYGQWLSRHIGTGEKNIQQFMNAISVSGYATDPSYKDKLLKTTKSIEKVLNNLI